MKKLLASAALTLLSLCAAVPSVLAQPPAPPAGEGAKGEGAKKDTAPEPKPANWTTRHSIQLGGQTVEYDAVVGSVILRDDKEKATAELFYTAYLRTGRGAVMMPIGSTTPGTSALLRMDASESISAPASALPGR